ncbi:MAG TPA: hypothetical protein VFN85_09240 [Solirubrobacterales bacterium]|nr:hypothetical protein [Solirubrobacterales bacterium]
MAVVFADPIRLKIVSELFLQEMGPSRFLAKFGGGTLQRVDSHFKRLVEYDCLRFVRTAPPTGPGAPEKLYRAPRLAIFDEETWAKLPLPMREEFSWRIFEQFCERVNEAMKAHTFDARPDRHFSWIPLVLDEQGRTAVFRAVTQLFYRLLEEQVDARTRLQYAPAASVYATVGLAAFDSPTRQRNLRGLLVPEHPGQGEGPFDEEAFTGRFARVFSSELNLKIMTELNLRPMSASEFAAEFGGDPREIAKRFRTLRDLDWLEIVKEETGGRRRGATEIFYRAVRPAIYDTGRWSKVPQEIRERDSWRIFEQMAEQVREAFQCRTFDLRADRHLTWAPLELDQTGWEQAIAAIDQCFHDVRAEESRAKGRLILSKEHPLIATVAFAGFESPRRGREAERNN